MQGKCKELTLYFLAFPLPNRDFSMGYERLGPKEILADASAVEERDASVKMGRQRGAGGVRLDRRSAVDLIHRG